VRGSVFIFLALGLFYAARARADDTEIVVTGQKSAFPTRAPTIAASRIDAEDLARPGASAAEVLAHVPGVQVASTGAASDLATASIRGASSAQTPIYLAGIRLNDDVTGTADLSLIPLWMLSRAEIYRGNAPDDADRMGIGGAIYFEPRTPKRTRGGFGGGTGSFGEYWDWLGAEVAHEDSAALVAFKLSSATNDYPYRDDNGTATTADDRTVNRQNADFTAREAWAVGRTALGERGARITTVFNAFDREQGVSGIAAVPALAARAETARVLAGISAKVPCSSDPSCELELVTQGISARSRLLDPQRELGLLVTRLDSRGDRVGQSARLSYSTEAWRFVFGTNWETESLALDGGTALRASRHTGSARVAVSYLFNERLLADVLAVATCDHTSGPNSSQSCDDLKPQGRFGARYRVGPIALRGNYGLYQRVPTLGELYGISPLVRGSSTLVPEQGSTFDLGARSEARLGSAKAYLDASGFAREVSDLIAYRRSSLGAITPYNVGAARMLGAELEAGAESARRYRTSLSLTLLDPRDTTPGRALANDLVPFQSRLVTGIFAEIFADPHGGLSDLFAFDARYDYRASRFADPAGLIVLPASSELDLGVSWILHGGNTFRAAIDDVFDAHHYDFIGYPVPGRSYHLSLEAWL
jgi:iron complex outermembrane receptor protein